MKMEWPIGLVDHVTQTKLNVCGKLWRFFFTSACSTSELSSAVVHYDIFCTLSCPVQALNLYLIMGLIMDHIRASIKG